MQTAGTLLSLDEYLDRDFEPEAELIAGELRPKPLGTDRRSDICLWLATLLMRSVGRSRVRVELSVRASEDVLIPDVCVLREKEKELYRGILAEPPLLCVEVVSPSQSAAEMLAKCQRYHDFGVQWCWVIDPVARRAWESHQGGLVSEQTATLTAGGLTVATVDLFSEDDSELR